MIGPSPTIARHRSKVEPTETTRTTPNGATDMGAARRRTDKATMEQRKASALDLLAHGHTYDQIAKTLGYKSKASAYNLVQQALEEHVKQNVEAIQEIRARELLQLQALEHKLLPTVLDADFTLLHGRDLFPVLETVDRIVKIKERRAKMLGLDEQADMQLGSNGNIQVIIDGTVVDKTRSEVEVEIPADGGGQ